MDDAGAGLDVVDVVAGEGSPCGYGQWEAGSGPVVEADSAVAQTGDSLFDGGGNGRVFERGWMNDQRDVQCSPEPVVGKSDGALNIVGDAGCI